jgi:act minimal PKS acyl carrier protein
MPEFALDDLTRLLRECAGEDETVDLDGADVLDLPFDDLGYDSLALHNTVNRIERECGVQLPDSVVADAKTPRELLDEINLRLRQNA